MRVSIVVAAAVISATLGRKSDPMGQSIADYGEDTGKYAGKYQQYMSSGDQDQGNGKVVGNVPEYSQKFMPPSLKSYAEAPAASYKTDSSAGTDDADHSKYINQNGGDSATGGSKEYMKKYAGAHSRYVHKSRNYSKYHKKYMQQGGQGGGHSKDYKKYMQQGSLGGAYSNDYKRDTQQGGNYSKDSKKYTQHGGGVGDYSKYQEKYGPHVKNTSDEKAIREYYRDEYGRHVKNSSDEKEVRDYYKKKYAAKYAAFTRKYAHDYSKYVTESEVKEAAQKRAEVKDAAAKHAEEDEASTAEHMLPPQAAVGAQEKHSCADGGTFHCAVGAQGCMDNSPNFCANVPKLSTKKSVAQASRAGTVSLPAERVKDMPLPTTMLVTMAGGVMLAVIAMHMHRRSQHQPFIDLEEPFLAIA